MREQVKRSQRTILGRGARHGRRLTSRPSEPFVKNVSLSATGPPFPPPFFSSQPQTPIVSQIHLPPVGPSARQTVFFSEFTTTVLAFLVGKGHDRSYSGIVCG